MEKYVISMSKSRRKKIFLVYNNDKFCVRKIRKILLYALHTFFFYKMKVPARCPKTLSFEQPCFVLRFISESYFKTIGK